ncbi:MAG: 5-methyltetrahydropteroyltriglutamate--homocysteine S-methyltransferase [Gammaproteobacteria bacterium]
MSQRKRRKPPFRAEHVGSLLRPAPLIAARKKYQAGKLSAAALREVENTAIRAAVRMQEELGLQAVTDGEFRRDSWHMDFLYQIGGLSRAKNAQPVSAQNPLHSPGTMPSVLEVTGPIELQKTIFGPDFAFLKSVSRGIPKISIPSPGMLHYRGGLAAIDAAIYPQIREFWSDLQSTYADQIAALAELGCRYLQLDDTSLAYLTDPAQREHMRRLGRDPKKQHNVYIELINGALAHRPTRMTVCTHLGRGNFRASWLASGDHDDVAEALFSELDVDGFFLDYDEGSSGGFEALRFVPKRKYVVLGLVSPNRSALESKDAIKRRIDAAAKYVPLEQICLSPQCGFAPTAEDKTLTLKEQRAKLALVVETAREVWG